MNAEQVGEQANRPAMTTMVLMLAISLVRVSLDATRATIFTEEIASAVPRNTPLDDTLTAGRRACLNTERSVPQAARRRGTGP